MSVFDDPRGKLQWLEEELAEEDFEDEEESEEAPRRRVWLPQLDPDGERHAVYIEKKKQDKAVKKLKFLAFLEILAILAVIWGWIKWLY